MSMSQRGLLSTMRLECWCNKSIPANATELASYLGLSEAELSANLTVNVLAFFKEHNNSYVCPELEDYRANIESKQQAQAEGGRKGGLATQSHRKDTSIAKGNLKLLSRAEMNRVELNRGESSIEDNSDTDTDAWVKDFDQSKGYGTGDYFKASRGE